MKYRDLLKKEHPMLVDNLFRGGCSGCPRDYGYEKDLWCKSNARLSCDDCWNREVPENDEASE